MKKIICFVMLFLLSIVSVEAAKVRSFYLTKASFNGAQALTACASGYHMASLWEIFDTSNIKYDTALGLIKDDSGSGPPSFSFGWIRTGFVSANALPGRANCSAWTSYQSSDAGTLVGLVLDWVPPSGGLLYPITPWTALTTLCNQQFPVWCMED
jgi:hypothetical protein